MARSWPSAVVWVLGVLVACHVQVSLQAQCSQTGLDCFNGFCDYYAPYWEACICDPGWHGIHCNIGESDSCPSASYNCKHGACNGGVCTCDPGWTGRNCDMKACLPGQYYNIQPNRCDPCPTEFFSNKTKPFCDLISPGYYGIDVNGNEVSEGAAGQQPCKPGEACPGDGDPRYVCDAGTYSPWASLMCFDCEPGEFSEMGAGECTACAPGNYSSFPGSEWCEPVPQGSFAVIYDSSIAEYNPGNGSTGAEECLPGSFCLGGDAPPVPCEPGTYADDSGADTCELCDPNFFSADVGAIDCEECPPDSVSFFPYTNCTVVEPGYFASTGTGILKCPKGSFCEGGRSPPQQCPDREVAPELGMSACHPCTNGTVFINAMQECGYCGPQRYSLDGVGCRKVWDHCPSKEFLAFASAYDDGVWHPHVEVPLTAPGFNGLDAIAYKPFDSEWPIGEHTVVYLLDVPVYKSRPQPSCNVTLVVTRGQYYFTSTAGMVFQPAGFIHEVLLSSLPSYGGGALLESIELPAYFNSSFTVALAADSGKAFMVSFPKDQAGADVSVTMEASLMYCRKGANFPPKREWMDLEVLVEIIEPGEGQGTNSVVLPGNGLLHPQHECIEIMFMNDVPEDQYRFMEVRLTVFMPDGVVLDDDIEKLNPTRESTLGIRMAGPYVAMTGRPAPGVTTSDLQPPVFTYCPADMSFSLTEGVDGDNIAFTEPVAVDNVDVQDMHSNKKPGDFLSIYESPITVEYIASDEAGNQAKCAFNIILEYPFWTPFSFGNMVLNETELKSKKNAIQSRPNSVFEVYSEFDVDDVEVLKQDTPFDPTSHNRVELTFEAPEGLQFRLRAADGFTQGVAFLVDIEFDVRGDHAIWDENDEAYFDAQDARLTVEFHNARDLNDQPISLGSDWFHQMEETRLDHRELQMRGVGSHDQFMDGFLFEGFTITLFYPKGINNANQIGGDPYLKLEDSRVQFEHLSVEYIEGDVIYVELALGDVIPPTIECPNNVTRLVNSDEASVALTGNDFLPTYSDNTDRVTLFLSDLRSIENGTQVDTSRRRRNADEVVVQTDTDTVGIGVHVVTFTAVDDGGNHASCSYYVTVINPNGGDANSGPGGGDQPGNTAGSTNIDSVVGGTMGAAVAVILIVLLVVFVRYRKMKNAPYDFEARLRELAEHLTDVDGLVQPREIRRSAIKLLDVLGSGNWGEVHKGLLEEHTAANIPGFLVAIKTLKSDAGDNMDELLREAAFMAQLNHENVVRLHGVVTIGTPVMMVMEFCEYGSLQSMLKKHDIDDGIKNSLSLDCALGLRYLASRGVVHRDIAARNVLVSSEKRGKIADFGLSRDIESESAYYTSRGGAIPVRWSSPEALEAHKFSEKSDVWSFGVLIYEIWTRGELPYKGMSNQKVWVHVASGYRLEQPDGMPVAIYKSLLSCWKESTADRPAFQNLVEFFEDVCAGRVAASSAMDGQGEGMQGATTATAARRPNKYERIPTSNSPSSSGVQQVRENATRESGQSFYAPLLEGSSGGNVAQPYGAQQLNLDDNGYVAPPPLHEEEAAAGYSEPQYPGNTAAGYEEPIAVTNSATGRSSGQTTNAPEYEQPTGVAAGAGDASGAPQYANASLASNSASPPNYDRASSVRSEHTGHGYQIAQQESPAPPPRACHQNAEASNCERGSQQPDNYMEPQDTQQNDDSAGVESSQQADQDDTQQWEVLACSPNLSRDRRHSYLEILSMNPPSNQTMKGTLQRLQQRAKAESPSMLHDSDVLF